MRETNYTSNVSETENNSLNVFCCNLKILLQASLKMLMWIRPEGQLLSTSGLRPVHTHMHAHKHKHIFYIFPEFRAPLITWKSVKKRFYQDCCLFVDCKKRQDYPTINSENAVFPK
jgi:hypothetical protein